MMRRGFIKCSQAHQSVHQFFEGCLANNVICCSSTDNTSKGSLASLLSKEFGCVEMSLGGLGGIPFVGKSGWREISDIVDSKKVTDIVLVYGCSTNVDENGVVGNDTPISDAFKFYHHNVHIPGALQKQQLNHQQAHLVNHFSRDHYNGIISHPNPQAKLVYHNFSRVQQHLRRIIDWPGIQHPMRLASIGGITIKVPYQLEPLFMPCSFELLNSDIGLYDLLGDLLGEEEEDDDSDVDDAQYPRYVRLHEDCLYPIE